SGYCFGIEGQYRDFSDWPGGVFQRLVQNKGSFYFWAVNFMQKSAILGLAFGAIVFIAIYLYIPSPECNDGWKSPSIGKSGACSWHGGVNFHWDMKFGAVIAGAIAGAIFAKVCRVLSRGFKINSKEENNSKD